MSLEKKILAACLHSREAFDKIEGALEGRISLPISDLLVDVCREYYARDGTAKFVDIDYVLEHIATLFDNPKKTNEFQQTIKEINGLDVSSDNIVALILEAKKKEVGHRLAAALANNDRDVSDLIEQYQSVAEKQEVEDSEEDVMQNVSIEQSIATVLNKDNIIKLPTRFLNDATDGGCILGHHIIVYARPETGKTALCIAFVRAFTHQGLGGIYFGNEDPIASIVLRTQCAFSGMTKEELRATPQTAQGILDRTRYGLTRFIPLHPGTPAQIEKYVKMYRPKWIVVDQLRNIQAKADTRVNQLEASATSMRNIAGKYGLVCVSVTQAGDSAHNKPVLEMGDIDFSNTGIPAQADLMIGMGVNPSLEADGYRMLSLPKNKLGGKHIHGAIRLDPFRSRIEDA